MLAKTGEEIYLSLLASRNAREGSFDLAPADCFALWFRICKRMVSGVFLLTLQRIEVFLK